MESVFNMLAQLLDESGAEILQEREGGCTENIGWSPIFRQ